MRHHGIAALLLSKVNGVYAAAAGSSAGWALTFLPVMTEWLKFGSALMSIASGVLAFYLALRNRKGKK